MTDRKVVLTVKFGTQLTDKDAIAVGGACGGGLDAAPPPPLGVVRVPVLARRRRLLLEPRRPKQPPATQLHGDEVTGVGADVDHEPEDVG